MPPALKAASTAVDARLVLDRRSLLLVLAVCAAAAVLLVPRIASRDSPRQLSPAEYRSELANALDGFDQLDLVGADGLDQMADKFRSAGEDVGELNPPTDAADANERLAAGLVSDGERMAEAADAGRAGIARYLMKVAEHGGTGWRWVEPFNELAAKGYTSSVTP